MMNSIILNTSNLQGPTRSNYAMAAVLIRTLLKVSFSLILSSSPSLYSITWRLFTPNVCFQYLKIHYIQRTRKQNCSSIIIAIHESLHKKTRMLPTPAMHTTPCHASLLPCTPATPHIPPCHASPSEENDRLNDSKVNDF